MELQEHRIEKFLRVRG